MPGHERDKGAKIMNTRRIVRISLLLGMVCLLAAVSFAAAQQPGPAKEAPPAVAGWTGWP